MTKHKYPKQAARDALLIGLYGRGWTQAALAREFQISKQRVFQIIDKEYGWKPVRKP